VRTRTRASTLIAAALAATFVAACGATPTPTAPAATPAPIAVPSPVRTSTPSSTPAADVSGAFATKMLDRGFSGAGEITGTMKVGALAGTISGSMAVRGADATVDMRVEFPGVSSSSTAIVSTGGRTFKSADGGPWFEDLSDRAGTNPMQAAFAGAALRVEDRGIVTKLGRRLHHLVPSGTALTAADLGLGDNIANARATIEFFARDDGGLAIVSVEVAGEMDSGGGPVPASMTMDFALDGSAPDTIEPPDGVWTTFTSKRHRYSIGVPAGWTAFPGKGKSTIDAFGLSTIEFSAVGLERQPRGADGLDGYVKAFIAAERRDLGDRPETNEGTRILGKPARELTYHRRIDGKAVFIVVSLLVRGRDAYEVLTVGPKGSEDEIRKTHYLQLGTFKLTGR
jgi:hypothetical protein